MKKIIRSQLKIGDFVEPFGFPRGRIETIENCSLESLTDGKTKKCWPCWTVRTEAARPMHKFLITDWGKDGIIAWKKSKLKFAPTTAKIWAERSGIEEMENIAGSGPHSYIYSMVMFVLESKLKKPSKLYCIERLRNDRIFRYEGFRVG